jgi:cutinase
MKFFSPLIAALAATTLAAPALELESRQTVGTTSNEFVQSGCRNVIFFFARGSTEAGNMV